MIQARSPSDLPPPWGELAVAAEETRVVRIGPRDLWAAHQDGEVWLGTASIPEEADPAEPAEGRPPRTPPEDLEWSRWATPRDEGRLVLRPVFPDRALVLEPERPFRLLPGAEARIFVRVPLWIRIELALDASEERSALLQEVPSVRLSDTWWGSVMEGEAAYWLPISARREMRPDLFVDHLAICPLLLRNGSEADLHVEKLAFQIVHLSLFAHDGHLWADESVVAYEGQPEGSRVEITGRPPVEAAGGVLVAGPRIPVQRGFRARTFDALRAIPGMGGIW